LAGFPARVKDFKSTMSSYQTKGAKLEKERLAVTRVPDNKREAVQRALDKAKTEYENEAHALNGKIKAYQYNRMIDLKVRKIH